MAVELGQGFGGVEAGLVSVCAHARSCAPPPPFSASVALRKQRRLWLLCPEAQVGMGRILRF